MSESVTFWLNSTKYDGRLHYRYPVIPVRRSEESLVVYSHPGTPVESYRGSWARTKYVLSHFWREKPYVLHVEWDSEWQPSFLYVDIATAVDWDDETVRYIDLDLDLIRRHNSATTELDDEDEFEAHRAQWNYPESLVQDCWKAVEEVRDLLEREEEPFSSTMYSWRPAKSE